MSLLNEISCSLIKAANFSDVENEERIKLVEILDAVASHDPEFVLKVQCAIYLLR